MFQFNWFKDEDEDKSQETKTKENKTKSCAHKNHSINLKNFTLVFKYPKKKRLREFYIFFFL